MSKDKYAGLSLTERLTQAGIFTLFSRAVKSGDTITMTTLLQQVNYPLDAAEATATTFLNDPNAFPHQE